MRLKWFAYEAFASLQAEPEVASSRQLMDRFLTEGFITVSEPIITRTHIDTPGPLHPFTMHCVKGVTRTLTVMAYFCWCSKNDVHPPDILVKTCCTIYVQNVNFVDAGAAIIAHCGGMRGTPHILSWVQTLEKLHELKGGGRGHARKSTGRAKGRGKGRGKGCGKSCGKGREEADESEEGCGKGRGKGCGKGCGKG